MRIQKKLLAFLLVIISVITLITLSVSAQNTDNGKLYFSLPEPITLEKGSEVSFEVVATAGNYEFSPLFSPVSKTAQSIKYAITVDGEIPFTGGDNLTAQVWFVDDGGPGKLSTGDETAPTQKQLDGFMESFAFDKTGIVKDFYTIKLKEGKSVATLKCLDEPFEISALVLKKAEKTPTYEEVSKEYKGFKKYDGTPIVVEGEKPYSKNDCSLTAKADNSSVNITPNNSAYSVINYIGGANWAKPYQEIVWEIDVPEDRLYAIDISFKQNSIINGCAFRSLKIDGELPFAEAQNISFPYKTAWQRMRLTEENGDDLLVYITKGNHKLSLTVTLGAVAEIYENLNVITERIGAMYIDIVMITGETPDSGRDYELYKQIPDFEKELNEIYNELSALSKNLKSRKDINGELDAAVRNMMRAAKQMHDERYKSHMYLDNYYSYYQTLCSWLFDIKDMSLALDKIVLSAPDSECQVKKGGFFEGLAFSFKRFIASFAGDYTVNSIADGGDDSIKIWVNWGRDQVKILNALIGRSFSAKTGINVKVEQVNASLIQGVVSNNSPDLYLQLSRTEPVNLAMRGVLEDLSKFEDFETVLQNFMPGAETPYRYNGGCYALPDTQSFPVMFYRTDIFEQLGLSVPETWDDFESVCIELLRNNMCAWLPIGTTTEISPVFPSILMQSGISLYAEDGKSTQLSQANVADIFGKWMDYYTKLKLPYNISFYNRFRTGTCPIGIENYTLYATLKAAATEIDGLWSIAQIPGTVLEDGTVSHTATGGGTGCAILNQSEHKAAAWEFLKWWTEAETQLRYSNELESVLGPTGRVALSNVEALSQLSWDSKMLETITTAWSNVTELPEYPGSYYVSRAIYQSFWNVANNNENAMDVLAVYSKEANEEIQRKRKQYDSRS